ncbi:alpha/beta hydrolase family protein [Blastopirellula marina]|uniref:Prolyl oligopeptidase family protein n=1 Tax=Blastopirellula marina DSM 3645 TaxID=314230 RepID=A3ZMT1_9BACT|nr:prolyl oligopeptidase family serine peptidase [Blastopirellula marina]EAQ82257.1 prolyl oligopeptidase family protein [Blastopirellula marina DSM 3645]
MCLLLFLASGCGVSIAPNAVMTMPEISEDPTPEELPRSADNLYVEAKFVSSFDGTSQPLRYALPITQKQGARPVLIFLHSWSSDYRLHKQAWLDETLKQDWIFVEPNFRGPNNDPLACGSPAARADILDSVDFAIEKLDADPQRIYLAGASGGGHMAMLMASRHPERFSAVSAWVGISDLRQWYEDHCEKGQPKRYAQMIAKSCGGSPGDSAEVDAEYLERSPIHWITQLGDLPLDIAAGVHDGQTGAVPFQHSVRLFNKLAASRNAELVSEDEMQQLWDHSELDVPQPQDTLVDSDYGRDIKMRRHAGPARLTIFEGGHEGLAQAACGWLEQFERATQPSFVAVRSAAE